MGTDGAQAGPEGAGRAGGIGRRIRSANVTGTAVRPKSKGPAEIKDLGVALLDASAGKPV